MASNPGGGATKFGRTSAATLGLVGGLALGAWIGSEMSLLNNRVVAAPPAGVTTQAVEEPAVTATPVKARRVTRVPRANSRAVVSVPTAESAPKLVMTIPVSAPELHQRMKPVLARGTKLPLAVEGFSSAEQFATLAHASRNTQVPFILLKHRVLTEGHSLEEAIRISKPDVDAGAEAARARSAAKSDMAALRKS